MPSIKIDPPMGELVEGVWQWPRHIYDEIPAENWSGLRPYTQSAEKALHKLRNREETDAMRFGTMYHHYILEHATFNETYAFVPVMPHGGGHLRMVKGQTTKEQGAENKRIKSEWEEGHRNYQWVSVEEAAQLVAMRQKLLAHPVAGSILEAPFPQQREVVCLGRNRGTWFKSLLDLKVDVPTKDDAQAMFRRDDVSEGTYIVDLKTCKDASLKWFSRACGDWGYLGQGAFYLDNLARATGIDAAGFVFVAQEKEPPYSVGVYQMTERQIRSGRVLYHRLLGTKRLCEKNQSWPGYTEQLTDLDVPEWSLEAEL